MKKKRNIVVSFYRSVGGHTFEVEAPNGRTLAIGYMHSRPAKALDAWRSIAEAVKDGRVVERNE